MMFPIVFYHAEGDVNTRLSDYLHMPPTETTKRPVYYLWKDVEYDGCRWRALYLSLFWTANQGPEVCCQRVVLLIDDDDGRCWWVYYGARGIGQGVWRRADECTTDAKGRLEVYVSPESHGLYPAGRRFPRYCGFANEGCHRCVAKWVPREHDFCDALDQSWSSSVRRVTAAVRAPNHPVDPDVHSLTAAERLFLFWPSLKKRLARSPFVKVLDPLGP